MEPKPPFSCMVLTDSRYLASGISVQLDGAARRCESAHPSNVRMAARCGADISRRRCRESPARGAAAAGTARRSSRTSSRRSCWWASPRSCARRRRAQPERSARWQPYPISSRMPRNSARTFISGCRAPGARGALALQTRRRELVTHVSSDTHTQKHTSAASAALPPLPRTYSCYL